MFVIKDTNNPRIFVIDKDRVLLVLLKDRALLVLLKDRVLLVLQRRANTTGSILIIQIRYDRFVISLYDRFDPNNPMCINNL